jgi:hypothetical protein
MSAIRSGAERKRTTRSTRGEMRLLTYHLPQGRDDDGGGRNSRRGVWSPLSWVFRTAKKWSVSVQSRLEHTTLPDRELEQSIGVYPLAQNLFGDHFLINKSDWQDITQKIFQTAVSEKPAPAGKSTGWQSSSRQTSSFDRASPLGGETLDEGLQPCGPRSKATRQRETWHRAKP